MDVLNCANNVACERLTPLELPVVPEVHTITADCILPSPTSVGLYQDFL